MGKTLIIAEAGVNHNGSIEIAKQLIDAAVAAGVDYVKFQTFSAERLVSKDALVAEYQQNNMHKASTQYEMLKKLELSPEQHRILIDYCEAKNIRFLSTAFDLESIDFLGGLHLGMWKVPSGEITNYPYLKRIANYHEPIILSTGMSVYEEILDAVNLLMDNGISKDMITILHCNTEYPTPMEDVNLHAMQFLEDNFKLKVGYSDHTRGIEVPIAAVALGAVVIEKHFTLSRSMEGPDHKASLEPEELKTMVASIRNIEKALGLYNKQVTHSEEKNIFIARKSIVAACKIEKGEMLTEHNLTVKRPGNGLSPMKWPEVVGRVATRVYMPDDLIEL
ncbi:N-acetylneuraminate synthase [Parabacteroides gordonii]|jgi:N,N'-diacetyllegionaminate synthase|uniref:N-acetylneuraminate synthase n=1 Tax=Parabacteroides gordonii TaxID=574930 RepID=UPI00241CAC44|nr:N-acetylneuraminate synthase [Parabacteroides gordonii]